MIDRDGFELVDHDFETGRTVWAKEWWDGKVMQVTYRIDQPVEDIIRENEQVRNIAAKNWKGDFHRIASVPLNLYYDSGMKQAIHEGDQKFASRWLNDSDNRAWRTKEGSV